MTTIVKEVHLTEENLTVKTLTPEEAVIVTLTSKNNPEVRLNVRIEGDLRRQLKAKAALRGLTMSDLIRELIETYLQEPDNETPQEPAANNLTFTEDKPIEAKPYRYFYDHRKDGRP